MPRGKGQWADLTGRKFGRLTVIGLSGIRDRQHAAWECRCDCGNAVFTDGHKLTTGQKKSCGCLIAEPRVAKDKRQLRLAFETAVQEGGRRTGICCIVDCGKPERSVGFCAHHYDMWNRFGHPLAGRLLHRRSKFSNTRSKEIKAYSAMKSRCYNPNVKAYANYGARGITVCDRWRNSFDAFLEDMGKAPSGTSLEREDVNGNYEPSNCRWATQREQMRNTRYTRLTPEIVSLVKQRAGAGEKIVAIARSLNVSYGAIYAAVTGRSWTDVEGNG